MTDRDLELLRLAGAHYLHEGQRVDVARAEHGLSPARFWAVVNGLIDDPAANLAEPQLCARLRRVRGQRQAARHLGRRLAS